jgi:hypothetical protein
MDNLNRLRHLWASIARDMVLMTLPQPSRDTAVGPEAIRGTYGLSAAELVQLMSIPAFKAIFQREVRLSEELGLRAAHAFRTAEMASDTAQTLYRRLQNPDIKLDELIKGYVALARSAGLDAIPVPKIQAVAAGSANVAVRINLPQLDNPKAEYLRVIEGGSDVLPV